MLRASTQATGAGTTTAIVAVPAGSALGDIAVLSVTTDGTGATPGWPTGFTELFHQSLSGPDGQSVACAWKRLAAADSGNYSVTGMHTFAWGIVCTTFSGRDGTAPPVMSTLATSTASNASPVSLASNAVTAVVGDDLVFVAGMDESGTASGSMTAPTSPAMTLAQYTTRQATQLGVSTFNNVGSAGSLSASGGVWTSSANHAGYVISLIRIPVLVAGGTSVTGTGCVTLTGLPYLRVTVTGVNARVYSGNAYPPNLFHVALLRFVNASFCLDPFPVTAAQFSVQVPSGYGSVCYSIPAGLTLLIEEKSTP